MTNRIYYIAIACMIVGFGFTPNQLAIKTAFFGMVSFALTALYEIIVIIIQNFNKPPKNNGNYKF
jgi:Sec-independent protein secretion pathway component TatC